MHASSLMLARARPPPQYTTPNTTPQPEDVFFLCTGETPDTLKLGRKVSARVRFVGENVSAVPQGQPGQACVPRRGGGLDTVCVRVPGVCQSFQQLAWGADQN